MLALGSLKLSRILGVFFCDSLSPKGFRPSRNRVALADTKIAKLVIVHLRESAALMPPIQSARGTRRCICPHRCDHMAGRPAIARMDALAGKSYVMLADRAGFVTDEGRRFFCDFGIDLDEATRSKRPLCRTCLDWSEERAPAAPCRPPSAGHSIFRQTGAHHHCCRGNPKSHYVERGVTNSEETRI
jgi:hypothetical protein